MKSREELQRYIDQFFTHFDFVVDEYDSERVDSMLNHELMTQMCQFISPECAIKNMITKERGYNILCKKMNNYVGILVEHMQNLKKGKKNVLNKKVVVLANQDTPWFMTVNGVLTIGKCVLSANIGKLYEK